MIYLKGVKSDDLVTIIDFLYSGEVNIFQVNLEVLHYSSQLDFRNIKIRFVFFCTTPEVFIKSSRIHFTSIFPMLFYSVPYLFCLVYSLGFNLHTLLGPLLDRGVGEGTEVEEERGPAEEGQGEDEGGHHHQASHTPPSAPPWGQIEYYRIVEMVKVSTWKFELKYTKAFCLLKHPQGL